MHLFIDAHLYTLALEFPHLLVQFVRCLGRITDKSIEIILRRCSPVHCLNTYCM